MTDAADIRGTYRHNKTGDLYQVLGEATHTETDEKLVIYRGVDKTIIWARPYAMFFGVVEAEEAQGREVPRFERVDPDVSPAASSQVVTSHKRDDYDIDLARRVTELDVRNMEPATRAAVFRACQQVKRTRLEAQRFLKVWTDDWADRLEDCVDDMLEAWSSGIDKSHQRIEQYLGVSWEEYAAWITDTGTGHPILKRDELRPTPPLEEPCRCNTFERQESPEGKAYYRCVRCGVQPFVLP